MNGCKSILSFLFSFLLFSSISFAQPHSDVQLNNAEVAAFMDSVVIGTMASQNAPGVGIVIVKDDSIFFSKGYGYADKENQVPVDPAKTLFRTASVCKTVTATVVLIARDEGLVDMNTDVNKYLTSFKIPEAYGKPITLKNLLTHTAGFDDTYLGKSARTKEEAIPLGEFLKEHLPERIMPPGEIFSYSNLGNALAAYVIEEVTGMDFEQYAVEKLLKPLDMKKSSYTLQGFQKDNLYTGYIYVDGVQTPFPFDHLNDYPAGQMLTTLNEFGNFMMMHLNEGKFNGNQVVDSSTIDEMHSVQFTHHPKLSRSSGYAFGINEYNGLKTLAHGGGYAGISTIMYLFPKIKMGVYAISNSSNGVPWSVVNQFMNKFFPYEEAPSDVEYPLTNLPEYDENIDRFTGSYRAVRYARNEMTKIGVLMGMLAEEMPVWRNRDGMIMMYDHKRDERRLIQVEPLLFQSIDDDYYMAFREDEAANVTHVFTDGTSSLEKINWYEEIWFNTVLFFTLITIFIFSHLLYFGYVFVNRREKKKTKNHSLLKCSAFVSGIYLIYYVLFVSLFYFGLEPAEREIGMAYGMPWYFNILQIIPFIGIIVTVFLIWGVLKALKIYNEAKLGIIYSAIIIIASLLNIWFMYYWQLLGWKF